MALLSERGDPLYLFYGCRLLPRSWPAICKYIHCLEDDQLEESDWSKYRSIILVESNNYYTLMVAISGMVAHEENADHRLGRARGRPSSGKPKINSSWQPTANTIPVSLAFGAPVSVQRRECCRLLTFPLHTSHKSFSADSFLCRECSSSRYPQG